MFPTTFSIAWRNLGRNKRRTLLGALAIAVGQFTLVFVNGIMSGTFSTMMETVTGPLLGHVQIHHKDWRRERAPDLYIDRLSEVKKTLMSIPEVTSVSSRMYASALVASGEKKEEPADAEPGMVVGLDVGNESQQGGVLEGLTSANLPGQGRVAVGRVLATRLGVKEGDLLAVIGQDVDGFPATDLYEISALVDTSVDVIKTLGIVMSERDANTFLALSDQAHEIVVQGEDYRNAEALAARMSSLPSLADAEVIPWMEAMPILVRMLDMKKWMDFIFLAIVFVAAAAGIANTAMMSTFERIREFGMLLAMGVRPFRVVFMVILESVLLGLIGVAVGSIAGSFLVLHFSETGLNYAAFASVEAQDVSFAGMSFSYFIYPVFELRYVLFGVLAVVLTSIAAAAWPAALAARLEPVKALRS